MKSILAITLMMVAISQAVWTEATLNSIYCPTDGSIIFITTSNLNERITVMGVDQAKKNSLAILIAALTAGKKIGYERSNVRACSPFVCVDAYGITLTDVNR